MNIGPISDTFDFLSDAALFAGKGFGYTDLNRPPLLPFLTSIFFIFGNLSVWPIFVVDGLLYVFGCIGIFLFLKERFDPLVSFVGSLLFATFPLILTFAGVGYNDVSGVAVAIWAMYLTYLAVNRNPKYFFLSFPMAMLAFLTRFNNALIIFPIFLYILINKDKINSFKNVLIGITLSLLVLIPVFIFFNTKFGNPIYPFLSFFNSSGGSGYTAFTEHFAYNSDPLYFLKNMPIYLGPQSAVVIVFTLVGLIFHVFKTWKNIRSAVKTFSASMKVKINFKFPLLLLMIILFLFTFSTIHYMFSEVIFFFIAYLLFLMLRDHGIDANMDMLFFSWFMAFLIFQSSYLAKDHRYIITMYAPLAYFLVRGLNWASNELKIDFKGFNLTKYLIACVLVSMMLFSILAQIPMIDKSNQKNKLINSDAKEASLWLIDYDPIYGSKVIYADFSPYFAWYLQTNVTMMSIFKNNQTLYVGGTRDMNLTEEDYHKFKMELESISPDYYISVAWDQLNFTSMYKPIKTVGNVTIFKRVN